MGAFLDWMDRFASGLSAGGGRMAGAGNAWSGARAKANEQAEQEAMKQAIKEVEDYDKAIQTIGAVNPQRAFSMAEAQRKFEQDYELNKMKLQKQAEALNSTKGEFAYLYNLYQDPSLSDEQRAMIKNRLDVLQQTPQLYGQKSYAQTVGRQQAEAGLPYGGTQIVTQADNQRAKKQAEADLKAEQELIKKERSIERSNTALEDTLNFVSELPEVIVGPYSNISQTFGAYSGGNIGFTDEQQMLKGELDRRIGEIENDIISVARANGQTGINTMQEIKQAAKGIATAKSKSALIGALKHMKELNDKYIELGRKQRGIAPQEPQEQVVDYTAYFGG